MHVSVPAFVEAGELSLVAASATIANRTKNG